MTESPAEQLYDVLRHVRPLHQYAAKVVADAQAASRVSMPMRAVLERLAADGPQPVPQIARSLWLSRQFVQRLVDEAVELGLVELRRNPAHRRSRLIALTEAGERAFAEIHAAELDRLARIAEDLDPAAISAARQVVAHLTAQLRELALQGPPDHGWSVPGPRPETTSAPQPAPTSGPQPLPQQAEEDA